MIARPLSARVSTVVFALVLLVSGGLREVSAQTQFIPYFGKNQIRYDNFAWKIYTTEHFEMYYYGEVEQHLERIAGYVESAYQHVSSELKHDLAFKVPIVLFATHSEFEQQNVIPGAAQEGVAAFAEPQRDRMLLPIDEPPDQLYRLIVHELTHVFQFDIIPRGLIRRGIPLWVDEGQADYMASVWRPFDLMMVRDAAIADVVPKMSKLEGYGDGSSPRLIYNLGHAVYEFIESKWGKEGIRQFMFALRKNVIGGGENAYEEAFRITADEFDQQFDKYLKDRFKPFRDKERPADYGRDLAPDREKTRYRSVLSIEPSPSGDLFAAAAVNRRDGKLDLILVSTKDGTVVRNLTPGFDQSRGYEYFALPSSRFNTVPWMSWSPVGDRLVYFVRAEKTRTLIVQNVLTRDIEQRVEINDIDAPESPDVSPDGRHVVFAGLRNAVGDIFQIDLQTKEIRNLTNDELTNFGPTYSADGKTVVFLSRISGNDKLFRLDLESGQRTQLTFGTYDETGAQFLDDDTLLFSSTATDPAKPLDPEEARNGEIFNIWTLSLKTGELRQYTDSVTGILSPVVLREKDSPAATLAFITYYKDEYGIHTTTTKQPIATAASSDFGEPGPVIDFQAPLTHTLVAANSRRKGKFEKLFLEGRPPVAVGVTSGGDFYGGTQIAFTDVLGDKQINLFASSVSQYRTLSLSYVDLERRFQYALQGYSQTQFYYGQYAGTLYDPGFGFLDRSDAIATRTLRGGTAFGIYPFNRYRRVELFGGVVDYQEEYQDQFVEQAANQYQEQQYGQRVFRNGTAVPLGVAFVQETTVFREFGPLSGNTMRLEYAYQPKIGNTLTNQTIDADARWYQRLGGSGLLALRLKGFRSWGDDPNFFYYGGNSELRGYDYLEFAGNQGFFANAELRFPLIEAMLTPIGVLGGVRGVFFAGLGASTFRNTGQPFTVWTSDSETVTPVVDYDCSRFITTGICDPVLGDPKTISGFRLVDGRASYGVGLQTFLLGFPVHFDWSWKTLFNKDWEDALFAFEGGSGSFRKPKFAVWIGFDY